MRDAVAVHRHGSGPPVVLLHANPGDSDDFAAVLPALAAEFTVLAVDWPGYGDSPAPRPPSSATAVGYADLLSGLLDREGVDRAAFIGNSLGGYAAARLAIIDAARVSALVLVNAAGFTPLNLVTRVVIRLKGSEPVTAASVGRLSRLYLRERTPVAVAMLARDVARRGDRTTIAIEAAIWRSYLSPAANLRDRAGDLTAPTLLVWGTRDPLLGRDGATARRLLPDARWHPLPTGHAPFAEAPDDFLAVTLPFLRRHAGT